MRYILQFRKTFIAFISSGLFFISCPVICEAQTISVIISEVKSMEQYNNSLSGFKEELKDNYSAGVSYQILNLNEISEDDAVNKIWQSNPKLILAVGTQAAILAKENLNNIPIVFSTVLNPVDNGLINEIHRPEKNLTGVTLNIDIEDQFRVLKKIIPGLKTIGMLYDERKLEGLKEKAEEAAHQFGLTLIAKPISSPSDVPAALKNIIKEADCLWATVDKLVYNNQAAETIILTLLQNKFPFMAFSASYVKAGALVALECDYRDIGRQAGEIAIKVLIGQKPESIAVASPRKTRLVINKRTADIIRVNIPNSLLEDAQIFGDE